MTVRIRHLDTRDAGFAADFERVLHWSAATDDAIETRVAAIVADVRTRGDAAVLEYTQRFDGVEAASVAALEIGHDELQAALLAITPAQRSALQAAADRVRSYHQRQLEACGRSWVYRDADGTLLGQKVTPLDRVGIYVPGGKAAYPSSVLMNAVPAQVAGVGEIVMVVPTPARRDGSPESARGERNPLVLAAAAVSGVSRVFAIGGAQAVAALAYGTATVPAVDKITGPGNAYVASAKKRVFGQVGIDMIAGPSEILVLADGSTPPDWVAMDLFSQAEHDELAQSILLSPDAGYIARVQIEIDRLIDAMRIDGASDGVILRRLIWPMLGPTTLLVLVSTIIFTMQQVFTPIDILTKGGPSNATTNLFYMTYQYTFLNFSVGHGAAATVILFCFLILVSLLNYRVLNRFVHYR